ncbi:uncharacterized protein LOC127278593 [Leptopilina boulardi]|uniref:uncharacterized protein LOC127278593 n=1 Tax=Leptopilina boulardi TaxID=63433 RepID=UPI0021F53A73|nr:uncharacterized protein LOC127278593 [Leptopilina boulardi]
MPYKCVVLNCYSQRKSREKGSADYLSFHQFPRSRDSMTHDLQVIVDDRRRAWIQALKQDFNKSTLKNGRICSKHFISGHPAHHKDKNHPDWTPSQNLGYDIGMAVKKTSDFERYERQKRRAITKINFVQVKEVPESCQENEDSEKLSSINNLITYSNEIISLETAGQEENLVPNHDNATNLLVDASVQTNLTSLQLSQYFSYMSLNDSLRLQMQSKLDVLLLTEAAFKDNDLKTKFFTGLDTSKILFAIHKSIEPYLLSNNAKLSTFQQLILTLMKLRLNLDFKYMATRYWSRTI